MSLDILKKISQKAYSTNPMDTNTSNTWWDSYRKTIQVTRRFRELVRLVGNKEDVARNMLAMEKQKCPGKDEIWYLNRLITQLRDNSSIGLAY